MNNGKLLDIVKQYYHFRGLTAPDTNQSFLFLVSEMGELSDALVADQAEWVRNNPDRERDVEAEIGDVLMMLTVFADSQGINPIDAMLKKMESKGFQYKG